MKKTKLITTLLLLLLSVITLNTEKVHAAVNSGNSGAIGTLALDAKTYNRSYTAYVSTTGERVDTLRVVIRYTEYKDSTGSYVSSIDNVYAYGGDISTSSFTMSNGYPTYSGIGSKTAKINGRGTISYVNYGATKSYIVNFSLNLTAGSGTIINY